MTQPEALRLADSISRIDTLTDHQRRELLHAAAELRRLHEDYENALRHFAEAIDSYKQMAAQRDALLEALRPFAAINASNGFTYKDVDRARAAIAKAQQ